MQANLHYIHHILSQEDDNWKSKWKSYMQTISYQFPPGEIDRFYIATLILHGNIRIWYLLHEICLFSMKIKFSGGPFYLHEFTLIAAWIISYPLFSDADTRIYPHTASQYHARPKAKSRTLLVSVDKFPFPRKETRGSEFFPCSNDVCHIRERFRNFDIPVFSFIWPKSLRSPLFYLTQKRESASSME